MAVPFVAYHPGTIDVENGEVNVVGDGTNFTAYNSFDQIHVAGYVILIDEIADDEHLTARFIYPGPDAADQEYEWIPAPEGSRIFSTGLNVLGILANSNLSSIGGLATGADKVAYYTGPGAAAVADFKAAARALLAAVGDGDPAELEALSIGGYSLAPIHVGNQNVTYSGDVIILISRLVDNTGSGNAHAFSDSSTVTRSGGIGYNSYDARVDFGGSANYDHYVAFQGAPTFSGSGTMDDLNPFWSTVGHSGAGTITQYTGFWAGKPTGAGPVTTIIGVYVDDMATRATNNWAIKTGGNTPSWFGGSLGLGGAPLSTRRLTIIGSGGNDGAVSLKNSGDGAGDATGLLLQRSSGGSYLWQYANHPLIFGTNNAEVGRFDAGGRLLLPAQPIWSATRNGLSPITSAGIIDWATPLINRGGHMSVSTHRWTSPGTGAARVTFAGFTDGGASATDIDASVRKNATAVTKLYGAAGAATGVSRYPSFCTVSVVSVDLNDILDLYLNAGSVRTGLYITASIEFIG